MKTRTLAAVVCALALAASADAQTVIQLSVRTNDLIYDPLTQRIYASIPSSRRSDWEHDYGHRSIHRYDRVVCLRRL